MSDFKCILLLLLLLLVVISLDEPSKALRLAAQSGDLRSVDHILGTSTTGDNFKMVDSRDENGWQPLHEAARTGSLEVTSHNMFMEIVM